MGPFAGHLFIIFPPNVKRVLSTPRESSRWTVLVLTHDSPLDLLLLRGQYLPHGRTTPGLRFSCISEVGGMQVGKTIPEPSDKMERLSIWETLWSISPVLYYHCSKYHQSSCSQLFLVSVRRPKETATSKKIWVDFI